jgi:hypothetical protein
MFSLILKTLTELFTMLIYFQPETAQPPATRNPKPETAQPPATRNGAATRNF